MTESERREVAQMRQRLIQYLTSTHEEIINYPPNANDDDYRFLVRKAIYYQELIDTLDQQLNENNE